MPNTYYKIHLRTSLNIINTFKDAYKESRKEKDTLDDELLDGHRSEIKNLQLANKKGCRSA